MNNTVWTMTMLTFGMTAALAAAGARPGDEYNGVRTGTDPESGAVLLPVAIRVDERRPVREWSPRLLGYNHNWMGTEEIAFDPARSHDMTIAPEYLRLLRGVPLPLNRMSGTVSQAFNWKKALGPWEERRKMKLTPWAPDRVYRAGVVEWVRSVLEVDPKAEFVFTLNLATESPGDNADLAEFLTGDPAVNPGGGENWAQRRVELGLREPVRVVVWELGNELDWGPERERFPTVDDYIARCRAAMDAVRRVDPGARFAPHAATAPWSRRPDQPDWKEWHRKVLAALGGRIDYLAFHPYYLGLKIPLLERRYLDVITADIRRITGSGRIRLFLSEHAMWPPRRQGQPWQKSWYQTHGLIGCLATAEWVNRMYYRPEVAMMAYHSFCAGPWGVVYRDRATGRLYTTGILTLFKLLLSAGGGQVVAVETTGEAADPRRDNLTFTASALTTPDGLNLILVNRAAKTARQAGFRFRDRYFLRSEELLTAPDLHAFDTVSAHPVAVTRREPAGRDDFTRITVPPKSVLVLRLHRKP